MKRQYITKFKLPDSPGVYIFKDQRKRPLYIGRATSLRDRVKSYFAKDLIVTRGPRIIDMVTKAVSISHEKTDSVLEAIILESALIKKYQPHYNIDERDDKSSQYVVITDEPWPRVFLTRARDFEQGIKEGSLDYKIRSYFGPYPNSGLIKEVLRVLRKLFPFRDKKALDARHDAFYKAIGRSPLNDDFSARKRYLRTILRLELFFEGKKDMLRKKVIKEMGVAIKELHFEEAGEAKRLLYALDHINDMSLIKQDRGSTSIGSTSQFRMEAYDIAHLAGTHVAGAFTVSVDGQLVPAEYRKFTISKQTNDDLAGLEEILNRRLNHTEWTYPDLIVVDGNEMHVKRAESVLSARRIPIPVVAVTKDEHHKAARILGLRQGVTSSNLTRLRLAEWIISLNAEAHRFVIRFHRHKRSKSLL